jgi:quercetin dioxygenase-like cupin family protein
MTQTAKPTNRKLSDTAYQKWMEAQGIPIHTGHIVFDTRIVERKPWAMTGTPAAFIDLFGMEGFSGMHVVEIPPGGATKPQKHLYQQLICILEGHGTAEVSMGEGGKKATFEWGPFSLFSPPLNTTYQLYNVGNTPVVYLAVNDAPMMIDLMHNLDFIFNNPYVFKDRFDENDSEYFTREERFVRGSGVVWRTNFIDNVSEALVDAQEAKGAGVKITVFDMAQNSFAGHLTEWPVGKYHKAHHHSGGAILLIARSTGYSTMWPQEIGVRPNQNHFEDQIVTVDWGPYSVFSPATKWFHQHFNTGNETARQLAFRPGGSSENPTGFRRSGNRTVKGVPGVYVSYREGGTLIEYPDEDPCIKPEFERRLKEVGIPSQMPDFTYNTDVY